MQLASRKLKAARKVIKPIITAIKLAVLIKKFEARKLLVTTVNLQLASCMFYGSSMAVLIALLKAHQN